MRLEQLVAEPERASLYILPSLSLLALPLELAVGVHTEQDAVSEYVSPWWSLVSRGAGLVQTVLPPLRIVRLWTTSWLERPREQSGVVADHVGSRRSIPSHCCTDQLQVRIMFGPLRARLSIGSHSAPRAMSACMHVTRMSSRMKAAGRRNRAKSLGMP